MNRVERTRMIKAMEFIACQINDEDVLEPWLMAGVADGDIERGDLSDNQIDDWYLDDDNFKSIMACFLRRMKLACHDGLYCDDILADERD